eukprot:CAMPEP_0172317850 /NCGR_PEP_ID=MMETSP1058-20130122/33035_1 /TAXON_ID=83371 /ORGANISM="Detonula confervacea, Strain CCMP 353" /LENGTH=1651 /DNA_ID=CAMNT_0013032517 /DNA_START=344 /DNA_END=5299 /DNA_ORIENTATION=+
MPGGGGGKGGADYYNNSNNYGYGKQQQQQQQQYNDSNSNSGAYADGGNSAYQQQQQHYEEDPQYQQEGYYPQPATGAAADGNEYYTEQYDDAQQQQQQQYGEYPTENYDGNDAGADPNTPFYPTQTPFVVHPNGQPDDYGNYDTMGDPISAIAIDNNGDNATTNNNSDVPSLMYVASHTSHQGERNSGSRNSLGKMKDPALARGSRLTVLYNDTNNATTATSGGGGFYGNRSMYSSFVGHPQADTKVLDGLHSVLFGGGLGIVNVYKSSTRYVNSKARPSHAYGPSFGPPSCLQPPANSHFSNGNNSNRPEEKHCMGITAILPVTTPYLGSGGRVCSISPNGIRVHTRGGMCMSEKTGTMSGLTCGQLFGGSQFATVGGMMEDRGRYQHVHCLDLQRDLKIVSSHTLLSNSSRGGGHSNAGDKLMCVTDMATNYERNNIVVGCSDGTIRVLDGGRRNAEVAKARAQIGGVAKVAVSENLICATGYTSAGLSSPSSPLPYPHPAPHVLLYDIRYLGRGGIPHMFSSNRGGPRFVNFLPDANDGSGGKLLVGSGQTFGSFEVINPFHNASDGAGHDSTFFQPELNAGESMTTVDVHDGELYVGTSYGRVLQYGLTNYDKTTHAASRSPTSSKEPLDMPPFAPSPPELSIDPTILLSSHSPASSEQMSHGWNVFDAYAMASNPLLSSDKALLHPRYSRASVQSTRLGPLSTRALVPPSKRWLSKTLQSKLLEENKPSVGGGVGRNSNKNNNADADFVKVFPTSSLELNDLLAPAEDVEKKRNGYQGKKVANKNNTNTSFPNPNKFIYSAKSFAACYDATANPRKNTKDNNTRTTPEHLFEEDLIQGEENGIPKRYRLMIRPPFYKETFDYTLYNNTGLYVGWDYAPSFVNSFACSVVALLYFTEEVRDIALKLQLCSKDMAMMFGKSRGRWTRVSITAELGLLFHLIESLSANGMMQPESTGTSKKRGKVKAFVPSNFISAFAMLPEATNLALLDGVAGSAEIARRPEAFYRFLMQYLERELGQLVSTTSTIQQHTPAENNVNQQGHLIDRMQGIGFLSIIEYARGKSKISTSRALTVDLSYDQKLSSSKNNNNRVVRFGEILRFSLCKEAPLRAWCEETRSYEAVIQRKIATSLPSLLSLSCCCAGRRKAGTQQQNGLQFWQQEDSRNWLPEFIEIQIETDKSITVKELVVNEDGEEEWMTFEQKLPMSDSFLEAWEKELPQKQNLPIKKSYRLDAVVSFIRTNSDDASSDASNSLSCEGHHVVHVRKPMDLESRALARQLHQIERSLASTEKEGNPDSNEDGSSNNNKATDTQITLVSGISLQERQQYLEEQLRKLKEKEAKDQWLLLNGFVVTNIDNSDDVRSFNAKFKEPSIVLFREITDSDNGGKDAVKVEPSKELSEALSKTLPPDAMVPVSVMNTTSISNGHGPQLTISDLLNLPTSRDLVAIDAEFVCVQPEESLITSSGSKEMISEPRNALARLSIINCQTNEVTIDDYILPQEPVVDYLTRFSGIRQNDLDTNSSPHHLVTPQEAYLKVRLLSERGCIFVGHGLTQDFRVINICIPPNQIIDTAEIFHQPNQRYISLRYLTNYVLGRDMQQEVHDSIEDARAAHELYIKALGLKREGIFDDYLMQLYSHGHRTQFKLGVTNDDE